MPGELLWRLMTWSMGVTKIEETLAMKNDERRGDEEDEYGSSKVWVGLGLGLVVWHAGAGSLVV